MREDPHDRLLAALAGKLHRAALVDNVFRRSFGASLQTKRRLFSWRGIEELIT